MQGKSYTVAIVGLWHLGCVTAACLAELGHSVIGVAETEAEARALNDARPPISEPGLSELIQRHVSSGRLRFTDDRRSALGVADFVWIAHDTPVDDNDVLDLTPVDQSISLIARTIGPSTYVMISSQVPVGTCARYALQLRAETGHARLAYVPENLRLGAGIERFLRPPVLVVGAAETDIHDAVAALLKALPTEPIKMSLSAAEMVKHALNSFLATSISFANELGNLCDSVAVNWADVSEALRLDDRIGRNARLSAGLGFSGGTLARDVMTLRRIASERNVRTVLLDAVIAINKRQNLWIERTLLALLRNLERRRICLLGLTYTANTSTLRRSASVEVADRLARAGATVTAFDPGADQSEVAKLTYISRSPNPYDAAVDSDAVALITPWPEFHVLDLMRLRRAMRGDVLLDPNGIIDRSAATAAGLRYVALGRVDDGRLPQ